jgi:protein-tyrosine phosphatase
MALSYSALLISYGGKRGLLRHIGARLWLQAGGFRQCQRIDWARVERFVFACKGNVCRSPYAEARATNLGLPAASFGLEAAESRNANASASRIALARGLDLRGHRSRPVESFAPHPGDLLIGMEPCHLRQLRVLADEPDVQSTLLGLWAPYARPYLHDPYGLADDYFNICFDIIDSAVLSLAEKLEGSRADRTVTAS